MANTERRALRRAAPADAQASGAGADDAGGHELSNKSVIKAAALLYELGHHPQGITVTDLAQQVGLSRPTAFRLLLSLEPSDFVERIEGKYRLGWKMARLGRLADPYAGLLRRLQPLLKTLAEQIRETIGYAVVNTPPHLDLIAEEVPESRMIKMADGYVGRDFPLHASAMGKLVLAELSDDDIRRLYPDTLPRFASCTLTRRSALLRALADIRQQGWACVDDELEDSHYALAVPVRDLSANLIGALAISGPGQRIKQHRLETLLASLRGSAAGISAILNQEGG